MGDYQLFQPLTKEDKVTVVVYRIGIALSSLIMVLLAVLAWSASRSGNPTTFALLANVLLLSLHVSVGLSVIFIHLYIGKFHQMLKGLYAVAIAAAVVLLIVGKGSLIAAIADRSFLAALLLPLSGCLGFITAKEAFCFRLTEGYLLTLVMPLYLLLIAAGGMTPGGVSYGLVLIAAMLALFTVRKVFMPLHTDIGDKSAYS